MKRIKEIKSLRKPHEKHFLLEDGTFEVEIYPNEFKKSFKEKSGDELLRVERDEHYLSINLKEVNNVCSKKLNKDIIYNNIYDGIDLKYTSLPNKVKESIIINNKKIIKEKFEFIIKTNLDLLLENKIIKALHDNEEIFIIDAPYMIDSKSIINDNIYYQLIKKDKYYELILHLDKEWLKSANYPVIIDPTITNKDSNNNVYDTYIYPNDTNVNRNNEDKLKIGMDGSIKNRALLKFELPTIGTGSQIISANLNLIGYPVNNPPTNKDYITAHRITESWNEETANWNTMNDKYDSKVEDFCWITMSELVANTILTVASNSFDITNLVKKWYSGTPNNGVMLKSYREEELTDTPVAMCFSKNNTVEGDNPKPLLIIHYRNQNGLESYLSYETNNLTDGEVNTNLYNGNLITSFDLGNTISGKFPVNLGIFYNTNDAILVKNDSNYNYGYGLGWKLSFHQTLEELTIEDTEYIKFIDQDGTDHYFYKGIEDNDQDINKYYDEDGLSLIISKDNDNYIMTDNDSNTSLFIKNNNKWYLKEITDTSNNKVIITYDSLNRITKITDANNQEISLTYGDNVITVVSPKETCTLNFQNNLLTSLTTNNGTTTIYYDNNDLISKIKDINNKGISFEYYNVIPYRIKKINELSTTDSIGKYTTYNYSFNATTITDEKNRHQTYTFNNKGNTIGVTTLDANETIDTAYGKQSDYYDVTNTDNMLGKENKVKQEKPYIKTINNLLNNTSFEEDISPLDTGDTTDEIINTTSNSGNKSLKIINSKIKELNVEKGNYYTFSAYIKNDVSLSLSLLYNDKDNNIVEETKTISDTSDEFTRYEVTTYYDEEATSNLKLKINLNNTGTLYIDDIQLEIGEVANLYNIISNSDFKEGIGSWTISSHEAGNITGDEIESNAEIVTLTNNKKALKLLGEPDKQETLKLTIPISGKVGDIYDIYFWYKNEGIERQIYPTTRHCLVTFNYKEGAPAVGINPHRKLNINDTEWQLYHDEFFAIHDYDSINVLIFNSGCVNNFYLTNFTLHKSIADSKFDYNTVGNMTSSYDSYNSHQDYTYDKNNQLIGMTDIKGANFTYEYDNIITNRILRGISAKGITNEINYDEFNNPINTKIYNKKQNEDLLEINYYIRQKGTNKYLQIDTLTNDIIIKNNTCSNDLFKLEKENNYYKIIYVDNPNYKLYKVDNNIVINRHNYTLFEITKNSNRSYSIRVKGEELYLTNDNDKLVIKEKDDSYNQEFYFEDTLSKLYVENKATYTNDGKFITSTTDTLGKTINYNINPNTGLTSSITDPKGIITNYQYNSKDQITRVSKDNREVNYQYNDNNLLSKIIHGTKEYNFIYDEFLNIKEININNNKLITNNYEENNGNLLSSNYGNNHTISYLYDDFDRIIKTTKMDDNYYYYYDNLGNITKIITNNNKYNYYYDSNNRLKEHQYNDFKVKYNYDEKSNITKTTYNDLNKSEEINFEYDEDENITKTSFDSNNINYIYDELGRLKEQNINNTYKINYSYITNGNKTSFILNNFKDNHNNFTYDYDELNNITNIYQDETLIHNYTYNNHNELIKDNDYQNNKTFIYTYDNYGNILSKKEYTLNTENLIKEDTYIYNNENWQDQLTKYNNDNIIYDEIGNPISIGNKTLIWTNGRELKQIIDTNKTINYKYNKDSIRTKKQVNNIITNYYLEGTDIVFEETNNNVIYYIRDTNNNLIGLKYNNNTYYYIKNAQDDIIGIMNSNYEKIAEYTYDAWGNILSIKDQNGNTITDETNIAIINPYRYRSYYYDKETNLYYLKSRYYNPVWGRFINADTIIGANQDIESQNLYTYCSNNPIINTDESGKGFLKNLWNGLVKGAKQIANYISKGLSKLVSIEINYTISKSSKKGNFLTNVESSNYTTAKTTIGDSNSIIKISINNVNNNILESSASVGLNFGKVSIQKNKGFFIDSATLSISNNNNTQSISTGIDKFNIFTEYSYEFNTKNSAIGGSSRVNTSILLPAMVYVTAYSGPSIISIIKTIMTKLPSFPIGALIPV